jgi:cation diffusion facilitator CzcD-associated flavoprotein CzcO
MYQTQVTKEPRAIIIGCGTAGIALGARLRSLLRYENFIIYEREQELGGTWFLNTYPGVGCDVDSHLLGALSAISPTELTVETGIPFPSILTRIGPSALPTNQRSWIT